MLCTLLLLLLVLNPFLHVIFAETVYACLWSCIFFLHLAESFHIPDIRGKNSANLFAVYPA
ncbi:hypothetical protein ES288_D06G076100v1 [Gossypium darwinii]|uniref:Uncharacterized protein n=1 Tax=Gossypium darwinii TaxID=34276 RepID=A0A5D2C358_GOSDA|nr:hypothetical protein ES288_D06G076100v1 [Gossypium darwinii]